MQTLDLKRFEVKPGESLPELLRKFSDKLRFRNNKKQAQIARDAWLDESYVSRLISFLSRLHHPNCIHAEECRTGDIAAYNSARSAGIMAA